MNAFQASDGMIFSTLEEAQARELKIIIDSVEPSCLPIELVRLKADVIDILTTTKTSRPKARKIHGGKKTRKNGTLEFPLQEGEQA